MMFAKALTRPRKQNAPRPAWKVADAFRQFLRGRPCACEGRNPDCAGRIEAAHAPDKTTKGTATKAADRFCIPLSEVHATGSQHSLGWADVRGASS
jgi:hypothetical protein